MSKAPLIQTMVAIGGGRGIVATIAGALLRAVEWVVAWNKRVRDRRLLARCDERMLRDIGIEPAAVDNESTVSFWRVR